MSRGKAPVVWGYYGFSPVPEVREQVRRIVAAPSRAAAARAFGVSSAYLRDWGSETMNAAELAAALAEPGAVFWGPMNGPRENYRKEEA
jgi:hypothetical protein